MTKSDLINTIANCFYPRRCALCDKVIEPNRFLCNECSYIPNLIANDACIKCGSRKKNCKCRFVRHHFKAVVAPFWYEGKVKEAILQFKFNNKVFIADYFANEMVKTINSEYSNIDFDAIVYVPNTKNKKRIRGYNQCEILANKISKLIGIKVEHKALIKVKENLVQHTLNREERMLNTRGAYSTGCDVKGKTLLLIDDIKSSGATLDECARQLLLAGADTVYCAVALLNSNIEDKKLEKRQT